MAFKRALWTSGYTYLRRCEYCGTNISYTDKQLDFRPWYPNGFVYCPTCRKPLRHTEFSAVKADGTAVYSTKAEADMAIRAGFYSAMNSNYQPNQATAPQPDQTAQSSQDPAPGAAPGIAFCPACGQKYTKGQCNFCTVCGKNLQVQ